MATQLVFNNTPLSIINLNNQIWISSSELSKALNYSSSKSVTILYNRNKSEFTSKMTSVIKLITNGINNNLREKSVRIFSLRGAHLIAMFANTETAREFRKWVLDILDNETQKTTLPVPAPVEPTDVKIETVKFYNHEIDVIFYENLPYLIVKQISDNIGINYSTSREQIQKRNDVNHSLKYIKLPTNGGTQRYLCLPLSMLNVWLQKLVPSRTKAGDMLLRYQCECFNFLFNHFAKNGYKKIVPVMTNNLTDNIEYEKLTAAQMRELTQKIHEISNQFHFSRTASAAIWFAIRYVTGTPSPAEFDVRHLPIITNECNRINAILTKYTAAIKQHERLIIAHAIRKRESIDEILGAMNSEIKSIENLTDDELVNSVKPCHRLASIDIVGQK